MRIHSDRVVLGAGPELRVAAATVTVEGGRITAVDEEARPAEPVDVELGRLALSPAFIDAHTHLAMTAFRGLTRADDLAGNVVEDLFFRLESALAPGDVRAFTLIAVSRNSTLEFKATSGFSPPLIVRTVVNGLEVNQFGLTCRNRNGTESST